jgi:hypothetical protein
MVSVEQWKKHFKNMARGNIPTEDLYVLKQHGKGFGRDSFQKKLYRVRDHADGSASSSSAPVTIVSPVAQTMEQVKAASKDIKKKSRKRKRSRSSNRSRGNIKRRRKQTKKRGRRRRKKKPKRKIKKTKKKTRRRRRKK